MVCKRALPWAALLLTLALSACIGTPEPDAAAELVVAVLDVGQGDAIAILAPSGKAMLVDGGNSSRDATQVILPYLEAHGCDRLSVLVLTHPDADHIGGLLTVLRSVPVDVVVSTGQVHTSQVYAEFLREVKTARDRRGTVVIRGVAGARVPFDPDVRVELLAPSEAAIGGNDKNNASIVLRLTYGQVSVLLTGDAEFPEETWLIDQGYDLSAQVLKVSHHGSGTASGGAFLDAVGAEVGLVSVGEDNAYAHPDTRVLRRLSERDVRVYRTDRQGTIEVFVDGTNYRVRTSR